MPDFDAQAEIASLRAIVSDLTSRVSRWPADSGGGDTDSSPVAAGCIVPYYEVTLATSLTLTQGIGDDWDPRFDDLAVATNRVKFAKPTVGGELQHIHIGSNTGKRFKVCWDSPTAMTVNGHISGYPAFTSTGGYIQVKLNGQIYEYDLTSSTEYFVSVETNAGRNQLVISSQFGPFFPTFEWQLFGVGGATWVDPSEEHGFVRT